MNELIEKEIGEVLTAKDIEVLVAFEKVSKMVEKMKAEKNGRLLEIFQRYGIESFENEQIKIRYIKGYNKKSVDTQKMKDDLIYNDYLKETYVADSIRTTAKEKI